MACIASSVPWPCIHTCLRWTTESDHHTLPDIQLSSRLLHISWPVRMPTLRHTLLFWTAPTHGSVARSELFVLSTGGILGCTDSDLLAQPVRIHHNSRLPLPDFQPLSQECTSDIISFCSPLFYDRQLSELQNSYGNLWSFHIYCWRLTAYLHFWHASNQCCQQSQRLCCMHRFP